MTKEKAMEALKEMPQDFDLDMFIERLIVIEKIEEATRQVEDGDIIYHSEMKKRFEEWKKK